MGSLPVHLQNSNPNSSPRTEPDKLITNISRVYLKYDVLNPPAHPGKGWTRFICISDTHGSTPSVPSGDVLIHAGDLTVYGSRKSFEDTIAYLENLPHPVKVVIAGNHDVSKARMLDPVLYPDEIENFEYAHKRLLGLEATEAGVRYLQFQSLEVSKGVWRAYGSPATLWRNAGAFQYPEENAVAVNGVIPRGTQILVTHGPPRGILDTNRSGKSCGCPALAARLFAPEERPRPSNTQTSPSPLSIPCTPFHMSMDSGEETPAETWLPDVRLHVFGHIHEARGAQIITRKLPVSCAAQLKRRNELTRSDAATTRSTLSETEFAPRHTFVETVFVNAAVQRPGSVPIIVDLINFN